MAVLTEKAVLAKTRTDSLENVRNLNMWGNDLSDVSIIERMPNVEVLSLSVNKISSLRDFGKCPKLQELYLRKNEVADVAEVRHLVGLSQLRVLWLCDNPCADLFLYRPSIVRALPQLTKLDNNEITEEERIESLKVPFLSPIDLQTASESSGGTSLPLAAAPQPSATTPPSNALPHSIGQPAEGKRSPGRLSPLTPRRLEPKQRLSPSTGKPVSILAEGRQVAKSDFSPSVSKDTERNTGLSQKGQSSHVLYAVMALLNELDESGLNIVKTEIEHKLGLHGESPS